MRDLPVKKRDEFLAEVETMDISALRDKTFIVAVATGDPDGPQLLATTIHGPYSFVEMMQEVGDTWMTHQHHCKVVVLDRNVGNPTQILDPNTVDYIELNYADLITEEMLGGAFDETKDFTCRAGRFSAA